MAPPSQVNGNRSVYCAFTVPPADLHTLETLQSGADVHRLEEVLLEYHRIGNAVRVSAIDPVTGTEVTIQGPASASETALRHTAITKLRYVLSKTAQQDGRLPRSAS